MTTAPFQTLPEVNKKEALDLVTQMMAIPGKSGEEGRVAAFIREKLQQAGIPASAVTHDSAHKRSPRGGEVGNLIVKLPGTQRGPRRLLMSHIDTVPLCVGSRPVRKGPVIKSRDPHTALGGDDRAGASVILNALLQIAEHELDYPPLTLLWPVQEEVGLLGARNVSKSKLGNPKLCFNWDGGAPHVATIGATGDYSIEIEIDGIASHAGAHPEDGVSAVGIAGHAIADLQRNGWHGRIQKGRNSGTSNIGIVSGGEATNVVTPRVTLRAEARSHNPQFRERIVEAYRKAFESAANQVTNSAGQTGRVRFQADLKYEAFRLSKNEPAVRSALTAIEQAGLEAETRICDGGLDANWMTAHGFPTVTLGCGQDAIHTVDEILHVQSYLHASRIALRLATGAA